MYKQPIKITTADTDPLRRCDLKADLAFGSHSEVGVGTLPVLRGDFLVEAYLCAEVYRGCERE